MRTILSQLLSAVLSSFRDRASLQLELVALRHQIAVLERKRATRPRLSRIDRLLWVWLYRLWPGCLDVVVIVKPDKRTVQIQQEAVDLIRSPAPPTAVSISARGWMNP